MRLWGILALISVRKLRFEQDALQAFPGIFHQLLSLQNLLLRLFEAYGISSSDPTPSISLCTFKYRAFIASGLNGLFLEYVSRPRTPLFIPPHTKTSRRWTVVG